MLATHSHIGQSLHNLLGRTKLQHISIAWPRVDFWTPILATDSFGVRTGRGFSDCSLACDVGRALPLLGDVLACGEARNGFWSMVMPGADHQGRGSTTGHPHGPRRRESGPCSGRAPGAAAQTLLTLAGRRKRSSAPQEKPLLCRQSMNGTSEAPCLIEGEGRRAKPPLARLRPVLRLTALASLPVSSSA